MKRTSKLIYMVAVLCLLTLLQTQTAWGQNSSLFARRTLPPEALPSTQPHDPNAVDNVIVTDPRLTLQNGSWMYRPLPPPKEIQIHDVLSVRVDLLARMAADGELRRRKDARYDARLKDWITLQGLRSVKPDPQTDGEPRMRGELRSDYRALGELETSESLAFNLACEVVDIRPNGNLVLEGRSKIVLNDECWTYVLSGLCRPEAIGPNNVVLSRDIINLDIRKDETGSVASGYQRGWFQKLFDIFQPF